MKRDGLRIEEATGARVFEGLIERGDRHGLSTPRCDQRRSSSRNPGVNYILSAARSSRSATASPENRNIATSLEVKFYSEKNVGIRRARTDYGAAFNVDLTLKRYLHSGKSLIPANEYK